MLAFSIQCATICFIIQILSKPFLVKYFGEILSFDNIGILFSTTDSYLAQNFAPPENNGQIFSTFNRTKFSSYRFSQGLSLLDARAKMLDHLRAGLMHIEEASPGCLGGGEGGRVVRDQEVALLTHL